MKKTITQFMAALVFAATIFTACKKEDDKSNNCGNYSLDGVWIRQDDPTGIGSYGMEITYSSSTSVGRISYVPSTLSSNATAWYVGARKWYGYDKSTCTINDGISNGGYGNWHVHFNNENEFVIEQGTAGDIRYIRK